MSGELRYTEKEMVMAKREAFESGAHWFYGRDETPRALGHLTVQAAAVARNAYPLPKVERPRVVTDPDDADGGARRWRFVGGEFETALWNEPWENAKHADIPLCASRVKMWADLLSHPSELVDDEG